MSESNRLIKEKSPYLLQHAYNPVDWYAWGEEAFKKAQDENKPIFLSIGYSTCYWCHVMEREVFENEEIAELMNNIFVNIKVDREERPDIDRVYMTALQSMTGSGGWPMSMFLTPELKPFYGATYVPPKTKYGMAGFEELIIQIEEAWKMRREEITEAGDRIILHIQKTTGEETDKAELNGEIIEKAIEQFKSSFDEEYGGFGNAPKFPRPVTFNLLFREYKKLCSKPKGTGALEQEQLNGAGAKEQEQDNKEILKMVMRTLIQMRRGGIYDQLGGGFHRYSVDRFWRVPHFEKMLYDQAQMVSSYSDMYRITKDEYFAETVKKILDYVNMKMKDKDGGFYSAEDAESIINPSEPNKKEEGAFYVWEKDEIDRLLGDDSNVFCHYYGVGERGNAPAGSDPHNVFTNKNILYIAHSLSETANEFNKSTDEADRIIQESKAKLFEEREKHPHPHLDDKILVSWNGLMISGFCNAYQSSGNIEYLVRAKSAAEFVLEKMTSPSRYEKDELDLRPSPLQSRGKEGDLLQVGEGGNQTMRYKLMHRYRDGEARFEGTLEDYAFFIQALIDLYESSFVVKYLIKADELTKSMIKIFYDNENGGFFDVSGEDKSILIKTKEFYDSAEPTGNSIAIMNLLRLSQILHNDELWSKAEKSLEYFSGIMKQQPHAMPQMLCALYYYLNKPKQIVISGRFNEQLTQEMIRQIYAAYIPNKVFLYLDPDNGVPEILKSWEMYVSEESTAYVCENYVCKLPAKKIESLKGLISAI